MFLRKSIFFVAALAALTSIAPLAADANPILWSKLHEPGHFAIMRHATAPGYGDPENFQIGDCSTQRNLSDQGREEAKAVGLDAKAGTINEARVYSSQWCRCLETARALDLGPVQELPALNSFFQRRENKAGNMKALRAFIADAAIRESHKPIILVTHQVTISALTGKGTSQGETIIFRHIGDGEVEVVGSIPPPS